MWGWKSVLLSFIFVKTDFNVLFCFLTLRLLRKWLRFSLYIATWSRANCHGKQEKNLPVFQVEVKKRMTLSFIQLLPKYNSTWAFLALSFPAFKSSRCLKSWMCLQQYLGPNKARRSLPSLHENLSAVRIKFGLAGLWPCPMHRYRPKHLFTEKAVKADGHF